MLLGMLKGRKEQVYLSGWKGGDELYFKGRMAEGFLLRAV